MIPIFKGIKNSGRKPLKKWAVNRLRDIIKEIDSIKGGGFALCPNINYLGGCPGREMLEIVYPRQTLSIYNLFIGLTNRDRNHTVFKDAVKAIENAFEMYLKYHQDHVWVSFCNRDKKIILHSISIYSVTYSISNTDPDDPEIAIYMTSVFDFLMSFKPNEKEKI